MLAQCNFCGAIHCKPHKKYVDRCDTCGKRYARYATYKSLQRSDPQAKRGRRLEAIMVEYQELRKLGYKVPRDIP